MGIRQYGQTEILPGPPNEKSRYLSPDEEFGAWGLRLCHGEEDGERIPLRENDVVSFYRLDGIERTVVIVPSHHRCWVPFGSTLTVLNEMPQWARMLPPEGRWFVVRLFMFVFSLAFSSPMLSVWSGGDELVWVGSIACNPPSTNPVLGRLWSWRKNMMLYLVEGAPMAMSQDGMEFYGSPACQLTDSVLTRFSWFPADIPSNEWMRFFKEVPPYRVTLDRTLTFRCD